MIEFSISCKISDRVNLYSLVTLVTIIVGSIVKYLGMFVLKPKTIIQKYWEGSKKTHSFYTMGDTWTKVLNKLHF